MHHFRPLPCATFFAFALFSTPLYPTESCKEIFEESRGKQREILAIEAVQPLQEHYVLVQDSLDELYAMVEASGADKEKLAEKIEELLTHAEGAQELAAALAKGLRDSFSGGPEQAKKIRETNKRVKTASQALEDITYLRSSPPLEQIKSFEEYVLDTRQALNPLVGDLPVLTMVQRFYTQALDSAKAIVRLLEGKDEEHDRLLQDFGPYGNHRLYPQPAATQRRLAAQRRSLYREHRQLMQRFESALCRNASLEAAEALPEKAKIDLARETAEAACENPDAEPLRKDLREAVLEDKAAYKETLNRRRVFQNARAQFRKRFVPDLELQQINRNIDRYKLALEKRLRFLEELDQEIEKVRSQEQTPATQAFIQERLAQREAEAQKKEKVENEFHRQGKLRERHFRMQRFAVENIQRVAEKLQQSMVQASETQIAVTQAECALNRCQRDWWHKELPSMGIDVETAREYLPILLDSVCDAH